MEKRIKYVWLILLAAYVVFIFSNSMTPAVASSRQSGFVLSRVQQLLGAVGLEQIGITEHIIRKLAHFTEYAGLGLLLCQTACLFLPAGRDRFFVAALLGGLIPFADETIQLFVEGRSGQISDVWLDIAGVAAGALIWRLWVKIGENRRRDDSGTEY